MKGQDGARGLPEASFRPIPHHGPADLARGGEADPDQGVAVGAAQGLDDHRALGLGRAFSGREELGPLS